MKTAALIVLLLSSVLVSSNGLDNDLGDLCGDEDYVNSDNERTNYWVRNDNIFHDMCKVTFTSIDSTFEMDITALRLDPTLCSVSVLDSDDEPIVSNITSTGYFTRTFKSWELKLHVQGTDCSWMGLVIIISPVCSSYQFTCNDGQCVANSDVCDGSSECDDGSDEDDCFWTVGTIIGVSWGAVLFVVLVAAVLIVYFRRRRVVVRHPMLIQPGHRSVGVASNPSSINGKTVVYPVK